MSRRKAVDLAAPPPRDLTDEVFFRWRVASFAGRDPDYPTRILYWWCRCRCGRRRRVQQANLESGRSRSCGAPLCRVSHAVPYVDRSTYGGLGGDPRHDPSMSTTTEESCR